ncbi:MAG: thioredoxin family protein [Planctomycetia bacterium]|nr:thioredoxin family protein [Planctomycetia bacterium]
MPDPGVGNDREPTREEIDHAAGSVLLEFGATWCGHCRAIAPQVASLLRRHPEVRHIKVEDGPGLPLGRSFRVKLWPTFVFLRDGREVAKAVRPGAGEVRKGLEAITGIGGSADQPSSP